MARIAYQRLENHRPLVWSLLAVNGAILIAGLGAAYVMEHRGHVVTGMDNQIVWGMPHVFAVFLIVAASGALNLASVASVFNRSDYAPYARLSGLFAIALLVGGLSVLVLDLGRPDRLIVAMTTYNFKSIFAWNIYLYLGFLAIVAAYLFAMMDRRAARARLFGKACGWLAFAWRLVLTTGTGSIFGWLAAREAYDAAIMAPLFIAASLLYGLAFTVLMLSALSPLAGEDFLSEGMANKFRGLLALFALAVLYFTAVHHLTKLYVGEHQGIERFLLIEGGRYTAMFWGGQILLGSLAPLALLAAPLRRSVLMLASALFVLGGLAQMYVTIIAGQAFPLALFPGMEVTSSFHDGAVAHYRPSWLEIVLGLSGFAIALLVSGVALKALPFLPRLRRD